MPTESTYTEELGKAICDAVASSEDGLRGTLAKLKASRPELPAYGTVMEWLDNNPSLAMMYAHAKKRQIEAMAEDIVDLSNSDELDANDKRIRIDTRKWLLSKLIPRTYGDKLDLTSGGEALATPTHQIDARVQSIIMQAQHRKAMGDTLDLPAEALKLLE